MKAVVFHSVGPTAQLPVEIRDDQAILLPDIFPTGYAPVPAKAAE
jgi:hypothetical protein